MDAQPFANVDIEGVDSDIVKLHESVDLDTAHRELAAVEQRGAAGARNHRAQSRPGVEGAAAPEQRQIR